MTINEIEINLFDDNYKRMKVDIYKLITMILISETRGIRKVGATINRFLLFI